MTVDFLYDDDAPNQGGSAHGSSPSFQGDGSPLVAPAHEPPGSPPGAPFPEGEEDQPVTLESIASELRELRKGRAAENDRVRQLELENARLQGVVQGGGGHQAAPPTHYFETPREYGLAEENLTQKGRLFAAEHPDDYKSRPEYLQLEAQYNALQADKQRFSEGRQRKQSEKQSVEIARASFLAARRINPQSEQAKMVALLQEGGVPLERIEAEYLEPRNELARMRADSSAKGQATVVMGQRNGIEAGVSRGQIPARPGSVPKTAEAAASDDLVDRFSDRSIDFEQRLFG